MLAFHPKRCDRWPLVRGDQMSFCSSTRKIYGSVALLVVLLGIGPRDTSAAEAREPASTPIPSGLPERVRILKGNDSVGLSVSFPPNGRHVVSSARRTMRFWNVDSGEVVRQAPLAGLFAVSSDGKRMANGWQTDGSSVARNRAVYRYAVRLCSRVDRQARRCDSDVGFVAGWEVAGNGR